MFVRHLRRFERAAQLIDQVGQERLRLGREPMRKSCEIA